MVAPLLPVPSSGEIMAHHTIPHFHNSQGLGRIEIGSKEFQCMGALPPFDHPHIYIDMGKDTEIVCSYCSTLYVYNPRLAPGTADPASALYDAEAA
jgi:uncharacterized Zn-finger protein